MSQSKSESPTFITDHEKYPLIWRCTTNKQLSHEIRWLMQVRGASFWRMKYDENKEKPDQTVYSFASPSDMKKNSVKEKLAQYHDLLTFSDVLLNPTENLKITLTDEEQGKLIKFSDKISESRLSFIERILLTGTAAEKLDVYECFETGEFGCEKNPERAVAFYQSLCKDEKSTDKINKDIIRAKFNLANCYRLGRGAKQDSKQDFTYYETLASIENPDSDPDLQAMWKESNNQLGQCYQYGKGVEQNNEKAFQHYVAATHGGRNDDAWNNLGYCHENGIGTDKNPRLAFESYRRASEYGTHLESQFNLARCYHFGIGTDKQPGKISRLYFDFASKGHLGASNNLGLLLEAKKGYAGAFKHYLKAAQEGYAEAQYNAGRCYEKGIGTEKDLKQAVYYYHLAAAKNHSEAQFNLGNCYQKGIQVKKDIKKAITFYELAANQEHTEAQYQLGVCYEAEKNEALAIHWYEIAVKNGHQKADSNLKSLYKKLEKIADSYLDKENTDDRKKAIPLYELVVKKEDKNSEVRVKLATCYLISGNKERAEELLEEAAEKLGNKMAAEKLKLLREGSMTALDWSEEETISEKPEKSQNSKLAAPGSSGMFGRSTMIQADDAPSSKNTTGKGDCCIS